jgi:four helix bundle protein
MVQSYQDLDVYKQAFEAALVLHRLSLTFPKTEQYGGIADQCRRSSKGICANLAEGLSKHSTLLDKKRFLSIAQGSAEETRVWLSFAKELGYIDTDMFDKINQDYQKINQMLYQFRKHIKF